MIPSIIPMNESDRNFYSTVVDFPWFTGCGVSDVKVPGVFRLAGRSEAVASIQSNAWFDILTVAQGDLTEYLSGTNYDVYGANWNRVAAESSNVLDALVRPVIAEALVNARLPESIAEIVLLDVGRAALERFFRKRFPKAPVFFTRLLEVYAAGHLPCGWTESVHSWPAGMLLVH
jgi:hypothetical protein